MCLIVLAFNAHADIPLLVAANRDEFHSRPTQDADWWSDQPEIVGGRDLQAGGTWLAVHRNGRFAAVTNYRDAQSKRGKMYSRGHLVTEFLQGDQTPAEYLQGVQLNDFAGFNLLVADRENLAYLSNRGGGLQQLPAGIYGLSNATLDTPWEKVERSKRRLQKLFEQGRINETHLLRLLDDRKKGPVDDVRSDHLPFSIAHAITAPFIVTPDYGTRCSTIIRADHTGRWHFTERRFDANGNTVGESQFSFNACKDGK
jgi:uncharacterized protein with NRDE domain